MMRNLQEFVIIAKRFLQGFVTKLQALKDNGIWLGWWSAVTLGHPDIHYLQKYGIFVISATIFSFFLWGV